MRLFLNLVPLSDKMYFGHMCTGRYLLMKVETIVSTDLSSIGNAPGHPVNWSRMVRICLFRELDVSHSLIRSIVILFERSFGNLHHLKLVILNFGLFPATWYAVGYIFLNVFVHSLPIVLPFYQTVGAGVALMS